MRIQVARPASLVLLGLLLLTPTCWPAPEKQVPGRSTCAGLIRAATTHRHRIEFRLRHVHPQVWNLDTGSDNGGEMDRYFRSPYGKYDFGIGMSYKLMNWIVYAKHGKALMIRRSTTYLDPAHNMETVLRDVYSTKYFLPGGVLYVPDDSKPLQYFWYPAGSAEADTSLNQARSIIAADTPAKAQAMAKVDSSEPAYFANWQQD